MEQETKSKRIVLFLCTGNYYRSRFAEIMFNIYALEHAIPWQAISRGIAVDLGVDNAGPISWAVLLGLEERGYQLPGELLDPIGLKEGDLRKADLIIALNEREHRPLMDQRFPDWQHLIEYWNIDDLDRSSPAAAMKDMDLDIQNLIRRLQPV